MLMKGKIYALGVLVSMSAFTQNRTGIDSVSGFKEVGLSIATDPREIEAALAKSGVDTASLAALAPGFPYSVVVRNTSTRGIRAIAIEFTLAVPNAPTPRARTPKHRFMLAGTMKKGASYGMLMPGEEAFLSAMGGAMKFLKRGNPMVLDHSPQLAAAIDRDLRLYRSATSVALVLDSVLYDDGEIVGPDQGKNFEVFDNRSKVDKHLLADIEKLDKAALKAYVKQIAEEQPEGDTYRQGRATMVLGALDRMDAAALVKAYREDIDSDVTVYRRKK